MDSYVEKLAYLSEKISDKTIKEALLINTQNIKDTFEEKLEELKLLGDNIASEIFKSHNDLKSYSCEYETNISQIDERVKVQC